MEHDLGLKEKPINWTITTLGEYLDLVGGSIQTGPFGSQLHASDYVEVGTPSVMPKNISVEGISTDDIAKVSEEDMARLSKYHLEAGDIVYSRRGDVEKCALVKKNETGWLCGTGCLRIRLGDSRKRISAGFLHAYLSSPMIREWISRNAIGATMPNLNTGILCDVPLLLPSVQEAKTIGEIWGDLNAKITLNRQINQTLEQMAQTLFKSWFVYFDPVIDNALDAGNAIPDELQARAEQRQALRNAADNANAANQPLGTRTNPVTGDALASPYQPLPEDIRQLFPNEFEESELGWVPKGWDVDSISSLIKLIGGGTPKTSEDSYWGGDIPWFSVVDAPNDSDVFVLDTEKKVTEKGVNNSSTKILRPGTTIISARGTVGKCALVSTPMAMNQSCYGVIGSDGVHDYFVYYLLRHSVKQLQQRGHGSVFNTITRDTFSSLKLAHGDLILTQLFGDVITPWFNKILANNQQKISLERLRDTLLPKLISGELRLDEVESTIAETTTV